MDAQHFTVTAEILTRGRLLVRVPFDPDVVWAPKPRHHVGGTLNGMTFRAIVERYDGGWAIVLSPRGLHPGESVAVVIEPEGPQRAELAEDVAAALNAHPQAAAFFDGLAQFYRKGYLRWIDATKRSPDKRAERIARMIELLEAGVKDYR
jgi:hypothetical protein